jgi:hypothetical protein
MTTIDNILFKIETHGFDKLSVSIPHRDKKILTSMSKMVKNSEYITESQANLTVKVLKENLEHLNFVGSDLITALKSPRWAKIFKTVEKIRKIRTSVIDNGIPIIEIEASFKKELKKAILDLQKNCEGEIFSATGKKYYLPLTEKNLVRTIDSLKRYNFEKSPEIMDLYEKIKSIDLDSVEKKFDIEHTDNEKLKNSLKSDIGRKNLDNILLLEDRKIAYQYKIAKPATETDTNSLAYKIATRKNPKIFLNNENFSLKDIALAIGKLKRSPILMIFDEYDTKKCISQIKQLKALMDELDINPNIGVHFRFDNKGEGTEFNKLVSEYEFNKKLDKGCEIAVLSNGKIPKFFLKTDWYPNIVISFTNHFRNNKTSVYCNNCDLILYYTSSVPVIGNVDAIL